MPPEPIAAMICAVHHGWLHAEVAKAILVRDPRHRGMLGWHLNFYLTDWMVRLHVPDPELVALYATLGDRGNGLTASARNLYQKDPAQLGLDEGATVILAMARPRLFRYPDLMTRRRAELLAAAQRMPALMNDCTN